MLAIQRPTKEDVEEIQQVFYETWLATYPNEEAGITVADIEARFKDRLSQPALQKRRAEIADESGNKLFLIAREAGVIVGVCKAIKKETANQLAAIYVLPNRQRRGIGKMFWSKVLEFFGDERDIIVHVATYNRQAIDFYEKLGFRDTGQRFKEEHFKMPVSGACIPEMELILKAGSWRK